MTKLRSKLYQYFAEQENTDLKKEMEKNVIEPSSPDPKTAKPAETKPGDGSNLSRKISPKAKKRILIWTSVSIIFLTIIGVWIYYGFFAPKSTNVSNVSQITKTDSNFNLVTNQGTFIVTPENAKNAYSVIYTTELYNVVIPASNNSLPISFNVAVNGNNTTGDWAYTIAGLGQITHKEGETPDADKKVLVDFYDQVLSVATLINWTQPAAPINWLGIVSTALMILVFIVIGVSMFKAMKGQGTGQEGIFSMGKSGAQLAKSNVKFSDVAGIKEEKEELSEIVDYLKHPQRYAAMGARTPKGVVLYGPPGTGKTLLAKAVAGEAGVAFFQISGSQFEDMLVGVGAKRVRNLFADARKSAPAIIFIDEIDSVASKRGKNEFGGGLADQTINQLLAEMDGFNSQTGIVVIAATNRLDVLDDAILRPGRFDRHIQINLPDIKEREDILRIHARNKNISKKVSLYDIARRTPGFSGAQLENVLNEATLLAVRNEKTTISTNDLDEAIDRVIAGPAKKSRVITPGERKLIAYHEAGHAIVGLYTPGTDVVQKITIIPRGSAAGYTMQTPEGIEKRIQSKEDLLSMIRMTLGGRASEEVVFGKDQITTGASNDLYKITNVVRAMVMQLGMSEIGMTQFFPSEGFVNPYQQQKLYSEDKAKAIDAKIEQIIQNEYSNAKDIISKNRKELDLIVECLLLQETILKDEIDYIHKNKKLPEAALETKKLLKEKEKAEIKEDLKDPKKKTPKKDN